MSFFIDLQGTSRLSIGVESRIDGAISEVIDRTTTGPVRSRFVAVPWRETAWINPADNLAGATVVIGGCCDSGHRPISNTCDAAGHKFFSADRQVLAQYSVDLAGRVEAFIDSFGVAGVMALVVLGVSVIAFQFVKGTGLSLFLLVTSYSLIFVESSGINTAAFFVRSLSLLILVLSLVRRFVVPGWAFWGMFLYAMMGLACSPRNLNVWWTLQNGVLLVVTIIALTIGLSGYLRSMGKVDALFRMFVVAGVIWCLASLTFAREFIAGRDLRFGGGSSVHATDYAASGALLFPFMLWAAMQRGRWLWRLAGLGGMAVILFCLFLSGTRTGFVVVLLSCAPLLMRRGSGQVLRVWTLVACVGVAVAFGGARLLQGRSTDFLVNRLTSLGFGGREVLWQKALGTVLESPIIGRGIGSHQTMSAQLGISDFHNAYLAVWCNAGALGLLLVLTVLGYYTVQALILIRSVKSPPAQDVLRLALGFLIAIAARGVVESSFASPSNASIALLLIATTLIATMQRFVAIDAARKPAPAPRPVRQPRRLATA